MRKSIGLSYLLHLGITAVSHSHKIANVSVVSEVVSDVADSIHDALVLEIDANDDGLERRTDVDPILVLEYHVVQDAAGVHYVHDLRKVIAWQRDFEDAEPLLENAKDSLDGLAHRLAAAHTNAYISIRISAYFTTYSYHYAIDLHCRLFLSVIQLYYRLFLSVIDLCYRPFSKNSRVWYP